MLFSDHYGVVREPADDWFDPILDVDTQLFIDPFLVFGSEQGGFLEAQAKIMGFFSAVYELAAETPRHARSPKYIKLSNALKFPEVDEVCLGYSRASTRGLGSGSGYSERMLDAVYAAIRVGLDKIESFEEIALLQEGVGPDRISDAMANLLKLELAGYTQEVCGRHCVPLQELQLSHCLVDAGRLVWRSQQVLLPLNPATGRGILLVPAKFLGSLPAVNSGSFADFIYDTESEVLRADFDVEVKRNLDVKKIVEIARKAPHWIRRFVDYLKSVGRTAPYDLLADPEGVYAWELAARDYVAAHPRRFGARDEGEFEAVIASLIGDYKAFIEKGGGHMVLWNDSASPTFKREKTAQLLFLAMVKRYCADNDIDVTPEAETGMGPIDFKFSRGNAYRVYIELKRSGNSALADGLDRQLPAYIEAENGRVGFLVVLQEKPEHEGRINTVRDRVHEVRERTGFDLRMVVVDATLDKPSASKLRRKTRRRP